MTDFRYKAFISYSHRDEVWARWLQHALESYRVPRRLVGKQGKFGEIPARLAPVFRDREDLSSAASLSESVQHEIASAETLVVVCSPSAAQSRWVNEEIKTFAALGRTDRIYTLIVEGDPQAADLADRCFPTALIEDIGSGVPEPLAADARKWADGKGLAKLKLVAGILGIRLDDLRQRDMQRRRRNWILTTVTVTAVVLLTTILLVSAISNRKAAEQRRANTEELLSYMLGTLEELNPVSGLDVLDQDQIEMSRIADQENFSALDDAAMLKKAIDWRQEGIVARDRGDNATSMSVFSRSLAALIYLYQRDKHNYDNLFELGQAEFWVGYEHWDNGDLDAAEESFTRYGVITRRLINADPKSAVNVLELSYTLTNLSLVESAREGGDYEKAIRMMQAALEYNQVAMVLEPDDEHYLLEMSRTQAHLADTWQGVCNLGKAYQFRTENLEIAKELYELHPDDQTIQQRLAYSFSGNALVQTQMGLNKLALENFRASEALLTQLARDNPENDEYSWERVVRLQRISQILLNTGREAEARASNAQFSRLVDEELEPTQDMLPWQSEDLAAAWVSQSWWAVENGRNDEARELNLRSIQALSGNIVEISGFASGHRLLASALFQYWQLNRELPPAEWLAQVEDYSLKEPPVRGCALAGIAARQAVMRGDLDSAAYYVNYLLDKGFYEPGFVRFCQTYGLCK